MTDGGPAKPTWRHALDRAARRHGVPLALRELLALDARTARRFLAAARSGRPGAFLSSLDLVGLERALVAQERGQGRRAPPGVAPHG